MSRKPIEENVKRRLFAESMGRCMNPNCRKELFESCGDIIEKAHIDPYSDTEDNSFENLVLLCPNCHTNFDKNHAFSVPVQKSRTFFDRKRFLMDREKTGADTMQALLEMI